MCPFKNNIIARKTSSNPMTKHFTIHFCVKKHTTKNLHHESWNKLKHALYLTQSQHKCVLVFGICFANRSFSHFSSLDSFWFSIFFRIIGHSKTNALVWMNIVTLFERLKYLVFDTNKKLDLIIDRPSVPRWSCGFIFLVWSKLHKSKLHPAHVLSKVRFQSGKI